MSRLLFLRLIEIKSLGSLPALQLLSFYCLVSRVESNPSSASVNAWKDYKTQSSNFYIENRELPYLKDVLLNLALGNLSTVDSASSPFSSSSCQQSILSRIIPIISPPERDGAFREYQTEGKKIPQTSKNPTHKRSLIKDSVLQNYFCSLVRAIVLWLTDFSRC